MDLSNLFSHPEEPEFISSGDAALGPVEHPTFSDRSDAKAPGAASL